MKWYYWILLAVLVAAGGRWLFVLYGRETAKSDQLAKARAAKLNKDEVIPKPENEGSPIIVV